MNGWKLVPIEPTTEMLAAGEATQSDCLDWSLEPGGGLDGFDPSPAYSAMIAASPSPPEVTEWQTMAVTPDHPVQVEFFMGNAPVELLIEPYRDERRELGFWDGSTWCEDGTGHSVEERRHFGNEKFYPTHYRILPDAPDYITVTAKEGK